jgi:translation initiation factor IF-3
LIKLKINQWIKAPELRVIDADGQNLGVLTLQAALKLAEAGGLDLIEISPAAQPPVAKIMDFGKFQYLENKRQKASKVKAVSYETKNLQVKIGTGDHDLSIKAAKASEFLGEGHRVKVELFLPGRSKYMDKKFLAARLDRLLKFMTVPYRVAEPAKPSPKGLAIIVERQK